MVGQLKTYYVYVLKSKTANKSYVGFTNDLERRLKEHNAGYSSHTKKYVPWAIAYIEEFGDSQSAIKREKYLKSAAGRRQVLKKIFE